MQYAPPVHSNMKECGNCILQVLACGTSREQLFGVEEQMLTRCVQPAAAATLPFVQSLSNVNHAHIP